MEHITRLDAFLASKVHKQPLEASTEIHPQTLVGLAVAHDPCARPNQVCLPLAQWATRLSQAEQSFGIDLNVSRATFNISIGRM